MSVTNIYPFDSEDNYTFDDSVIEVSSGQAALTFIDNTGQTFTEDFADDTGFTYDSDKVEFTGGLVQQKDQTPTNSLVGCKFDSFDLNWTKEGSLTGTSYGAAVLNAGKMDVLGGVDGGVYWDNAAIGDASTLVTIKLLYTPNYSGAPATNRGIVELRESSGNINRLLIMHGGTGAFRTSGWNSSGGSEFVASTIGAANSFLPTSGVEYEIMFTLDTTTGTIKAFVDGTLIGTVTPGAYTRTDTATLLQIGAGETYTTANGSFDDVMLFSDIQETTTYTPGYTVPDYLYTETKVELPQFEYTGIGSIQDFTNLVTVDTNSPQQIWNDLYWTGSAWASSDGTFAQSNTVADIVSNIATFPASDTLDIDVVFESSNAQMSIDNLIVTYTGQIYSTTDPVLTLVESFRMEELLIFLPTISVTGSDAVKFSLLKDSVYYYHNGSNWVEADETYSQTNTAAEITTNIATFTTESISFDVAMFFHSDDGSTTPSISNLSITYDFAGDAEDDISICTVYWYARKPDGTVCTDTITAVLSTTNIKYKDNIYVCPTTVSTTPDAAGYVELDLMENANMIDINGDSVTYTIYQGDIKIGIITVPDTGGKLLWDILG